MLLENLTWREVKALNFDKLLVVLPTGAFEQHGPHLPLTTDTDIVTAVARGVEQQRPETVLCLPTLWLGHSTHHLAFPGTLSTMQANYMTMLTDVCKSIAAMGARRVFLLNGHGGNDIPAKAAMRELKSQLGPAEKQPRIVFASYWSLAAASIKAIRESQLGGLGHACEMETSIMLHLCPDRVQMQHARRDGPKHESPYRKSDMQYARPVYFVNEFHEVTENGTIGHPDLATPEKGARFLEAIIRDTTAFVDDFATWE
ncbi:MAG: creatininase family protein [Candidatus Sumerlaeaceae bacterium]